MNKNHLWLLPIALLFLGYSTARGEEVPLSPLPTAAADVVRRSVAAEDVVAFPQGYSTEEAAEMAGITAELEADYRLLCEAFQPKDEGNRIEINACQGQLWSLGWLARLQKTARVAADQTVAVSVSGDSWLHYHSRAVSSKARSIYKADLDGDKVPEEFCLRGDSRIEIRNGGRIIGVSQPLGSFTGYTLTGELAQNLPSAKYVAFDAVQSINSIEFKNDTCLVNYSLAHRESLFGLGAWSQNTLRHVNIAVARDRQAPVVVVDEPAGLNVLSCKSLPFKGQLEAPQGILSASLSLNGNQLWASPLQLQADSLDLDLRLNLQSGSNVINIEVTDRQGRSVKKLITLTAPPPAKSAVKRALIIGAASEATAVCAQDAIRVREALVKRGYIVKTLTDSNANRTAVLKAVDHLVDSARGGDRIVIYFAGASVDTPKAGKTLLLGGSPDEGLTYDDLAALYGRLPSCPFLFVCDSYTQSPVSAADEAAACHNLALFADGPGANVLMSGDPQSQVRGLNQGALTQAFIAALDKTDSANRAAHLAYSAACRVLNRNALEKKIEPPMPVLR